MNKTGKVKMAFPVFELMMLVNILYYMIMLDKNSEHLSQKVDNGGKGDAWRFVHHGMDAC